MYGIFMYGIFLYTVYGIIDHEYNQNIDKRLRA